MVSTVPGLSQSQIDQYWADGYVNGITILTEEQMAIARRKLIALERAELDADPEQWSQDQYAPWLDANSEWWRWFQPMVTHPRILAAVEALLGPNILIRNADIFIKPAQNMERINWHVDSTASMEDADKMLTAWFAISESKPENGCMEFLPGSHRLDLPDNVRDKENLTFAGVALKQANRSKRASNVMRAGQLSLHHFRTAHSSSGNATEMPRIGLVIRFIATDVSPTSAESGRGFLAAGHNDPGHFSLRKNFPVTWQRSPEGELQSPATDAGIG
jgi:ectoine hydroxylase-related dioxygenase (phytanoyl-CoA dioxygenase family)